MDLQRKLMTLFSVVFLLLLLLFGAIMFSTLVKNSRAQLLYSARQSQQQAMAFLSNKVNLAVYVSDVIYYDLSVHRLVLASTSQPDDLGNEYRDFYTVWTNLKNFQSDTISNIRLYLENGSTYVDQEWNFGSFEALKETDAYQELVSSEKTYLWSAPWLQATSSRSDYNRVVSVLRLIRSLNDYNDIVSAVQISLEADQLDAIMHNAGIADGVVTYVLNAKGEVIAASDPDTVGGYLQTGALRTLYGQDMDAGRVTVGKESYICLSSTVSQTDWELTMLIPLSAVYASGFSAVKTILLCGIPIILCGLCLIWLLSRSFGQRVAALATRMESVQEGDLNGTVTETPPDELGRLGRTFNYMLGEIRNLMRQQYESGKLLKQSELKILQAQINPHFLYNTLDLINWKALDCGADDIAELTQTMGKYYRRSLSKGQDFVKIQSELEHLTLYVRIQNYRFDGRIQLISDVPDSLLELEMMKLVLQPLVENAVLHGVDWENDSSRIQIHIAGRMDGSDVVLEVTDDGIGIDEDTIRAVLSDQADDRTVGYGLRNIHLRLKLCYGEAYGLSFSCVNGTCVRIRIPAERRSIV